MRELYQKWIDEIPSLEHDRYVEPPPGNFEHLRPINRSHRMEHPTQGTREDVASEQVDFLRSQGWRLCIGKNDFLEMAHLQAWYFEERFFPRMRWITLETPPDVFFIIADRPVLWGFAGNTDVAPSALRHPEIQLVAPLSRSIALLAVHHSSEPPEFITPSEINGALAVGAHEWIAGPTEATVEEAMSHRTRP